MNNRKKVLGTLVLLALMVAAIAVPLVAQAANVTPNVPSC